MACCWKVMARQIVVQIPKKKKKKRHKTKDNSSYCVSLHAVIIKNKGKVTTPLEPLSRYMCVYMCAWCVSMCVCVCMCMCMHMFWKLVGITLIHIMFDYISTTFVLCSGSVICKINYEHFICSVFRFYHSQSDCHRPRRRPYHIQSQWQSRWIPGNQCNIWGNQDQSSARLWKRSCMLVCLFVSENVLFVSISLKLWIHICNVAAVRKRQQWWQKSGT